MEHTKTAAHDFINKVYEGRPAEHATIAHAAIDNPLLRENMPVAQSVFANYSHGLKNADHWQVHSRITRVMVCV